MEHTTIAALLSATLLTLACGSDSGSTAGNSDTLGESGEPKLQVFEACEGRDFAITAPAQGYPWTPNAITLVSEEVAAGVFVVYDSKADEYEDAGIPLATTGGFVIGEEGVAVIETMLNRQLFCQFVDLIQAETDKPILYAINTSYHGDHSYGNAFLPEEVQIVQHERSTAHIAEHFEADIAFMEAAFGDGQGIDEITLTTPDIEVPDTGWSVDLGGVTIEAQYHGFAQTSGDLFIYVPEAKALWTGNPLIAAKPAIPWLLDGHAEEVEATLAKVRASLPAGAIVIPGHGRPAKTSSFDFSIDYLGALIAEVQSAVDGGESAEEAMESVTLDNYKGYAIWDWVHTTINVPMTYAEISGSR